MKQDIRRIFLAFAFPSLLLFTLYFLWIVEMGTDFDFTYLGIYPREWKGIGGILTSPLIHAGFGHLFANTVPLLFLSWCLFYFYRDGGYGILLFVWFVTGVLTFLIGKPGWHVGASGIIYALAFFLFLSGVMKKYIPLVALSLLITFLYGSLIWNMFPQFAPASTSWEGHLSGAVTGIAAAILFRNKGPQPPPPLEDEVEEASVDESSDETSTEECNTPHEDI